MRKISGIPASEGIEIRKVYRLEEIVFDIPQNKITDIESELDKLNAAFTIVENDLISLRTSTADFIDEQHAEIFDAHIQILKDPEIYSRVNELISSTSINVISAYNDVCKHFELMLSKMDNEYMKERAADIKDVSRRVISILLGVTLNDPSLINEEVIVIAHDLTPSDTVRLNRIFVKGFITNIGGKTSHSAIIARTLEIPAVVGTKDIMTHVQNNDVVILDGINGEIIICPDDNTIEAYDKKKMTFLKEKDFFVKYKKRKTKTLDNKHLEIAANIGSPDDIEAVLENGAEGIGLFRTEFLFMNTDVLPSEDFQVEAYKKILEKMESNKVIIRTIDVGGDKDITFFSDNENKEYHNQRGLRLCLSEKSIFKTQLRALLRASIYGNLHIMFPMVETISDLLEAKELLHSCKQELTKENKAYSTSYKLGIMIEVPDVARSASIYAKEVEFFSIGTNDLIQYLFEADRMNSEASHLYQPYNPKLLKLIKNVIDASHEQGIWTGMCGEMAADEVAVPLLLGLGLDEFSMSSSSIPKIRYLLHTLDSIEMKKLVTKALHLQTNQEVEDLVKKSLKTT